MRYEFEQIDGVWKARGNKNENENWSEVAGMSLN